MRLSISIALLSASALWAADLVPMDVKTGQWETTTTRQMTGIPQLPPEQLARMPADQRARLEAIMKQAGNGTSTNKSCVKKEDLTNLPFNDNKNCKTTVLSSSRTKQEMHMDCDINGTKATANVTIEAIDSNSVKFTVQGASAGGGGNMNLNVTGTSKWLGPTCTDAK